MSLPGGDGRIAQLPNVRFHFSASIISSCLIVQN
jgi:hypothetical protein